MTDTAREILAEYIEEEVPSDPETLISIVDQALTRARSEAFGECAEIVGALAQKSKLKRLEANTDNNKEEYSRHYWAEKALEIAEKDIRSRASQPPASGRRPIEEAPKDGTTVWLWSPDAVGCDNNPDGVMRGFYVESEAFAEIGGGAWFDPGNGSVIDADPTQWQPYSQPTPPMESADAE